MGGNNDDHSKRKLSEKIVRRKGGMDPIGRCPQCGFQGSHAAYEQGFYRETLCL